jgi:hypothetical protein
VSAPATLDAVSSARPRTLIIGTDLNPAGAAAILTAERGLQVRTAARVARSLPVRTRNATGAVHDYGDPRLLHEPGLVASLAAAWLDTPIAVAGVEHDRAVELCAGDPAPLPTTGASAGLFALAGMADAGTTGPLVAVEQASLSGITVSGGVAELHRREPPARPTPVGTHLDGAAALVLAAEDVVDRFTDRPVWIRGVGLGLDSVMHQHKLDMTTFPATTRAAKQAFAMAGMTPADVDVAEVHDFFTGIELISYEDLGFAERFGGYKLVEAEVTSVGGALPVNPSGGLTAKGHPPGATGVAQCVELFAQLRGEAANQVDGARVALAHHIGEPTAVSAVTILEGPLHGAR